MCLNGTCCNLAITIVWTELFGAMRAPYNRQIELYPIRPKNKSFDLNFDLFMVKLWSNFGQKMGYLTIKFEKNEKNHFYFVYSNKAHEDGFGELSWAQKARSKL